MLDSLMCKICLDAPIECVVLPCSHQCTCLACGKKIGICPICRKKVNIIIRTYIS